MKSIKIQSKRSPSKKSGDLGNSSPYDFLLLNNKQNPGMRQQLVSILAEVCTEIENKTPIKLNLQERIKSWLDSKRNSEEESGRVLKEFGNFIIESIGLLVRNNEKWRKPDNEPAERIIRIKSEERIKYRLLRQGEGSVDVMDEFNEENKKEQEIYNLKNSNKRLERKLLLLSSQFNKIKKTYEAKIQKYKRLLNSSLIQLQSEVNEQLNSDFEEFNYPISRKYKEIESQRQESMREKNLRQAKSQKYRSSIDFNNKIQRVRTQQSMKYVSIPPIPILGSGKLPFNHHIYHRG